MLNTVRRCSRGHMVFNEQGNFALVFAVCAILEISKR